jgi:hypothetical protein
MFVHVGSHGPGPARSVPPASRKASMAERAIIRFLPVVDFSRFLLRSSQTKLGLQFNSHAASGPVTASRAASGSTATGEGRFLRLLARRGLDSAVTIAGITVRTRSRSDNRLKGRNRPQECPQNGMNPLPYEAKLYRLPRSELVLVGLEDSNLRPLARHAEPLRTLVLGPGELGLCLTCVH